MVNESIYENGSGGQLYLLNNDIARSEGLAILAYLNMFGGNVQASTQRENNPGELRFDWWGNNTSENSGKWINSQTERVLRGVSLSAYNISKIRQAVVNDLRSLEQYGTVDVLVTLPGINRVKIDVSIKEPSNKNSNTLILIWDQTKRELIEQRII